MSRLNAHPLHRLVSRSFYWEYMQEYLCLKKRKISCILLVGHVLLERGNLWITLKPTQYWRAAMNGCAHRLWRHTASTGSIQGAQFIGAPPAPISSTMRF